MPFKMVVIGQLLAGKDVPQCIDAHTGLSIHHPFLSFTVWIARVIYEARPVSPLCGIDDLIGAVSQAKPHDSLVCMSMCHSAHMICGHSVGVFMQTAQWCLDTP